MNSDSRQRLWRIHGRVQGVGFRGATRARARQLGLSGHACNLSDGSVSVIAEGSAMALDELERWLWEGPRLADVTRVEDAPGDTGLHPTLVAEEFSTR